MTTRLEEDCDGCDGIWNSLGNNPKDHTNSYRRSRRRSADSRSISGGSIPPEMYPTQATNQ